MCLYVTADYKAVVTPNFIAPTATPKSRPALYHLPYTQGVDYDRGANAVPNGLYAITGPHPSERIVASTTASAGTVDSEVVEPDDVRSAQLLRLDSARPMGEFRGTEYAVHATTLPDSHFVGSSPHHTHHYGYTTCENLRVCNLPGELPGSACYVNQSGVSSGLPVVNQLRGWCYTAADASLQCGRSLETLSSFGDGVRKIHGGGGRCPTGADLSAPGRVLTKRMLIGGCMNRSDASYKPLAEIHIPADCSHPASLLRGCLFPGARNYLPGAVESAECIYTTLGCTSTTALNYNPYATLDDLSCVEPVPGCTVPSEGYAGVNNATPAYKQRTVGVPSTNVGQIVFPEYANVRQYDPLANVLRGCEVVVEGCMDSSAINYEPHANQQSDATWCVPRFEGCMMPMAASALPSMEAPDSRGHARNHTRDGGSANFVVGATVNALNGSQKCRPGRVGCMSPTALNFDPHATMPYTCYERLEGCLDRTALNYGCSTKVGFQPCSRDEQPAVTIHVGGLCNYAVSPPPMARPSAPADASSVSPVVVIEFVAAGDVADFDNQTIYAMKLAWVAALDGVDISQIVITVRSASVHVFTRILAVDLMTAAALQAQANAVVGTVEAANAFFAAAGVTVLSTPEVWSGTAVIAAPPSPPANVPLGAIVGGAIGAAIGLLIVVASIWIVRRRRAAKVYQVTYPEPADAAAESGPKPSPPAKRSCRSMWGGRASRKAEQPTARPDGAGCFVSPGADGESGAAAGGTEGGSS